MILPVLEERLSLTPSPVYGPSQGFCTAYASRRLLRPTQHAKSSYVQSLYTRPMTTCAGDVCPTLVSPPPAAVPSPALVFPEIGQDNLWRLFEATEHNTRSLEE
ncbi:hypothetical protein K439DRAFT_1641846 [Ramaria rubella]|nr:hypothetical protein K439DRAFT_1641846 [Ramaria rubella]